MGYGYLPPMAVPTPESEEPLTLREKVWQTVALGLRLLSTLRGEDFPESLAQRGEALRNSFGDGAPDPEPPPGAWHSFKRWCQAVCRWVQDRLGLPRYQEMHKEFAAFRQTVETVEREYGETRALLTQVVDTQTTQLAILKDLTESQRDHTQILKDHSQILKDHSTTLKDLGTQVENLNTQVENLNTQVEGLNTQVEGLNTQVEGLNTQVEGLDTKVTRIETQTSGIRGEQFERMVRQRLPRAIRELCRPLFQQQHIRVEILYYDTQSPTQVARAQQALGLDPGFDLDDQLPCDVIAHVTPGDDAGDAFLLLGEAALHLNRERLHKAVERAAQLRAALPPDPPLIVVPMILGERFFDDALAQAAPQHVLAFQKSRPGGKDRLVPAVTAAGQTHPNADCLRHWFPAARLP